ncbi:hypothetical protein [Paraburkholderia sp. CI3]|uniref:hypothetical protein n=1 Tax=Paraburkholderia sp. CI3 TaxID=2991060 RepID=UPI003D1D52ED
MFTLGASSALINKYHRATTAAQRLSAAGNSDLNQFFKHLLMGLRLARLSKTATATAPTTATTKASTNDFMSRGSKVAEMHRRRQLHQN